MDIFNLANISIGIAGLIVAGVTSYLLYRRSTGARGEKIKSARREVINILLKELADNTQDVAPSVVEALLNNKYRECGVDSLTIAELPLIIDDLITYIAESAFILSENKKEFVQKALRLKQRFEKGETNLEEAITNWRKSSIFLISLSIAFTVCVGILSGLLTVIILAKLSPSTVIIDVIQMLWLVGLAAALFGFQQYRTLQPRRDKGSRYLHKVLEHNCIEALRKIVPNAIIEKHARVDVNKHLAVVDLIMSLNEKRLPVEIKHSSIRLQTIEQIENVMNAVNAKRGLLITTSAVGNKLKELARKNGIIVLDKVTSESDIVEGLRNTELFG